MPFLTIGALTVEVQTSAARENEVHEVGSHTRAFSGKLRSTVRAEFREWSFTTGPLTQAQFDSIRGATRLGQHVLVGGDAIGTSTLCLVEVRESPFIPDNVSFRRFASLTIREVNAYTGGLVLTSIAISPTNVTLTV